MLLCSLFLSSIGQATSVHFLCRRVSCATHTSQVPKYDEGLVVIKGALNRHFCQTLIRRSFFFMLHHTFLYIWYGVIVQISWKTKAPISVQRISLQSKCPLVVSVCKNSQDRSPASEIRFAVMYFFSFNHLFVHFICGIITMNNAGIPIAGKKLGAIPNKYFIVKFPPV